VNGVEIRQVRYDALVSQALIAAAQAELGERYGGTGDGTPICHSEFEPPAGAFFIVYLAGEPAGCAGWRSHGSDGLVAELKRLYICPKARRNGIARALLSTVEESAQSYGRTRMILECGDRQPEAISLYLSMGYQPIDDFGFYRCAPDVVSLGRDLVFESR
jgi:GNAT superfamily N-acetyltransferase